MPWQVDRSDKRRARQILKSHKINRALVLSLKLFDPDFYVEKYGLPSGFDGDALDHFFLSSDTADRDPNAFFSTSFYHEQYSDIKRGSQVPLLHYMKHGASELRDPSPAFSTAWYVKSYPDVVASGINPLAHYLMYGRREGRRPTQFPSSPDQMDARWSRLILDDYGIHREYLIDSQLFDFEYYLKKNPLPDGFNGDALDHFLLTSPTTDRDPNAFFSTSFYREKYRDVGRGDQVPLLHYIKYGASELRDPSPAFSTAWYATSNPDVVHAGFNPLAHYLLHGQHEGRPPVKPPRSALQRLADRYRDYGEIGAATLVDIRAGSPAIADRFSPNTPLNVFPDDRLNARPHLNMLIPSLQMRHASGGPNTVLILGMLLARAGIPVRFLSTDAPLEASLTPIKRHMENLSGFHPDDFSVELVDACSRERSVSIGRNDIFFATAWWTARMAKSASRMLHNQRFLYFIQDYESLFYGAGENLVDAADTYDFDYFPVINSRFLRDHLVAEKVGKFADPAFAERAIAFDPAISKEFFEVPSVQVKRRVLFYARPTIAARNLFALGVAALRAAIASGVFDGGGWEFVGMGEAFEPVELGQGHVLRPAPWLGFAEYARLMRESRILLSLMLSPHPSYPPLEMAACGGMVVTTAYGSKTTRALSALSPNIIGVAPKIEDLVDGLHRAVISDHSPAFDADERDGIALPRSWIEAFSPILPAILAELGRLGLSASSSRAKLPAPRTWIRVSEEVRGSSERYIKDAASRRRANARVTLPPRSSVATFTDGRQDGLVDLAHTVLGQTPVAATDWLIATIGDASLPGECVEKLAGARCHAASTVVEAIRWALESATGDYLLFTHPEGKLFPDALHAIASFLSRAGLPNCAVTRVELVEGDEVREADGASDLLKSLVIVKVSSALEIMRRGGEGIGDVQDLVRLLTGKSDYIHSLDEVLYSLVLPEPKPGRVLPEPLVASETFEPAPEVEPLDKNPVDPGVAPISILTPLYHGSDTEFFRETARSVREQTQTPFEWLVLAQGVLNADLVALLEALEEEGLARVVRTDKNAGIAGGLRKCLELAKGEMCLWLDGDDLLTPDAIEGLAKAIADKSDTAIFYTDEDIVIGTARQSPFHRPDFDPALVLSHSYVYHLIVFRRDLALELGAFTSDATEFAQDWDILVRFYLAGHVPAHIAEVLVHWRHHAKSTSGSGEVFKGSIDSIKGVLSMVIEHKQKSAKLEVAPYPIALGAPDFYIKRFPIHPPGVRRVDLGSGEPTQIPFPFRSVERLETPTVAALFDAMQRASEDFVMLCNTGIFEVDALGLWQADKHFDLIPECVAVGGPITDAAGKVVCGGPVRIDKSRLVDTEFGRPLSDPGPFSLHLKPHCVDALALDLLVARSVFLRKALETCPPELGLLDFGAWLGAFAETRGRRLVYEPLLSGRCKNPDLLFSDSAEGLSVALRHPIAKAIGRGARPFVLRGTAGFARNAG